MNRRIFIATGVFCMFAAVASPAIAEDVLLMDFEKGGDFLAPRVDPNDLTTKPSCSAAINANWATQGKSSAQITLSQYQLGMPEWPGINLVAGRDFSVTDWSPMYRWPTQSVPNCPPSFMNPPVRLKLWFIAAAPICASKGRPFPPAPNPASTKAGGSMSSA